MYRIKFNIKENGELFEVFSIYLSRDGSFKVDVPYCDFTKAAILKMPITYQSKSSVPREKNIQEFYSRNRPQLSIHASGFVQFSGKGILSGIEKLTRKYKGIAIQSVPLTTPIGTGPTFGVKVWGLKNGYKKVAKAAKGSITYDAGASNSPEEFYERRHEAEPLSAYLFEGWVFPDDDYYSKTIRVINGEEWMALRFPNYIPQPNKIFVMRIIRLKNIKSFIAIIPSKISSDFPSKHPFGFILGSPTERSKKYSGEWESLQAIFPDFLNLTENSLDFDSSTTIEPRSTETPKS